MVQLGYQTAYGLIAECLIVDDPSAEQPESMKRHYHYNIF